LLAEARRAVDAGTLPASSPVPPRFDRMIGVELRPRVAALARIALKDEADIIAADARRQIPGGAQAVVLFDVLHLMTGPDQDALLSSLKNAVPADAVILVREADRSAGWRFRGVQMTNRLKALVFGAWRQPFCFRTRAQWLERFTAHGFDAELRAPSGRSANVLFRLTPRH
jgi:hypothetical protein